MRPGPKLKSPNTKRLAGTYKPSVDRDTTPIVQLPNDIPSQPSWLSEGAKEVWAADIDRVVAAGAREVDTHFVATYAEWMAGFIAGVKAGSPPNAAYVSELRKLAEMLGIAGAKARLARIATPDAPTKSPFTVRPT